MKGAQALFHDKSNLFQHWNATPWVNQPTPSACIPLRLHPQTTVPKTSLCILFPKLLNNPYARTHTSTPTYTYTIDLQQYCGLLS
eukprot:m.73778 g.73778  ORF g.73778 m.73778 type:complete len:85 (-) comp12375_c0_seq1:223-477(-)